MGRKWERREIVIDASALGDEGAKDRVMAECRGPFAVVEKPECDDINITHVRTGLKVMGRFRTVARAKAMVGAILSVSPEGFWDAITKKYSRRSKHQEAAKEYIRQAAARIRYNPLL